MELTHHPSALGEDPVTRTDTEAEKHMEAQGGTEYKGGIENSEGRKTVNETTPADVSDGLSVKMHQRLSISKGSFRTRRPRLQWTKSFPPFSQCIGGHDEDVQGERVRENDFGEEEVQCDSELRVTHRPHLRVQQRVREESTEEVQFKQGRRDDERTNDTMTARESRDELKARWRAMRRQRLGGSDGAGWVRRERWNGRGRMEETGGKQDGKAMRRGKETRPTEEVQDRSLDSGRMSCPEGDLDVNSETDGKEAEGDERKSADHSEIEGGSDRNSQIKRMSEDGEGPVTQAAQWPSPHPILSRLLHSSTASSSSSFTFSSAESDEVFSDMEDAGSKRKTFRKCRSWKTFLTMMQWSVGQQTSWVQLAGHQGNFQTSEGGEVLKLYSDVEASCLTCLMTDPLKPFVPQYHGLMTRGGLTYIRLEDLLCGLKKPVIMDCKMGVRTYLEEELVTARNKPKLRSDMYEKMVKADLTAPSAEEHAQKGVTKWRYLQWKDKTTSTSTLGLRIEGIMMENGSIQRDFRKIQTLAQVTDALLSFTKSQLHILKAYHSRLQALSEALNESAFFKTHEVIGSSLLFVHDHSSKASVWMIDFGKTVSVLGTELQHNVPWAEGNGEDGYLIGLATLTSSLSQAISKASWQQERNSGGGNTEEITKVD